MAFQAGIHRPWRWFVAALAGLALLIGCSTPVQPVLEPPVIEAFAADDDAIPIGSATTLRWTVTNADAITINDGADDLALEPDATTLEVNPTADTLYTLTASNTAGEATATVTVTVEVPAPLPVIVGFAADDDAIPIGTATTLRWTVTDADAITIDDGADALALEAGATSLEVNPTADTLYTLTASNTAGEATATITVAVRLPPSIADLTHDIVLESRVRLAWAASHAEGFAVYAVTGDGDAEPIDADLDGASREATVAIPVATRQTLRVCAVATGFPDVCEDATLHGVVTSAADWDPYFLEGFTPEPEIPGSLRSVILAAAPGSVIGFAADVTEIELRGVDLLQLGIWQDAHLILTKDLTISGPPAGVTLRGVSAAGPGDPGDPFTYRSRMIYVVPGVTVHLDGLIVTGGTFIFRGGAIRNDGDLTISRSRIVGNRAWQVGGGVLNHTGAVLHVVDSVLEDNQAVTEIDEIGATYAIRGGYVICMTRASFGGGLFNAVGAVATFVDTPIRGNQATVSGGGVYNEGDLTLVRSPVTGNVADHTVFTGDPAYPDPPDYVDHPVCPLFTGPFSPTSAGGGILQAVGATLELIDSPVTGNSVGNVFTAIGGTSLVQVADPDRRGVGADAPAR